MSDRFPSINPLDPSVIATGHVDLYINGRLVELQASGPQYRPDGTLLFTRNANGAAQDGAVLVYANGAVSEFHRPGLEGWSCHNGIFAGWGRGSREKAVTVSRSGHFVGLVDLGGSVILEVDGVEIDRGAIAEPRYTGEALVWSKIVNRQRRTFGRLAHGAPTEDLTVLNADEFWPRAIETPRGVYVLNHSHPEQGHPLFLRAWGERQRGHIVAHGFTDRPDAIAIGHTILVAFSNLRELVRVTVDLNAPTVLIAQPSVSPPLPPIDPPPTEPPNVSVRDVPNLVSVIERTKNEFPAAWRHCHRPDVSRDQAEEFARRAAYACHLQDRRFGLNGKRGDRNTISQDCVCFLHDDGRESVIDFGGGAGGDNPTVQWSIVGHYLPPGPPLQIWIRPEPVGDNTPTPNPTPRPTPNPTPAPTPPPVIVDLSPLLHELQALREAQATHDQNEMNRYENIAALLQMISRQLAGQ